MLAQGGGVGQRFGDFDRPQYYPNYIIMDAAKIIIMDDLKSNRLYLHDIEFEGHEGFTYAL